MTIFIPSDEDYQNQLLVRSVEFAGVTTLPQHEQLPNVQRLTYHFDNGYGAQVLFASDQPLHRAFSVCLLDCTRLPARPTSDLPLCPEPRSHLPHSEVLNVLIRAERLGRHPRLTSIDEALLNEEF